MKTNTNHFDFVVIATKSKLLATVNSCRKILSLLPITLAVLFSLKSIDVMAQNATPMFSQFSASSKQFDKLFNDEKNNQLILTYHKDITVFNGQDVTPGAKIIFMNKLTGIATIGPEVMRNAKHIYMYDNKLFYIIDSVNLYSYDLTTAENKLLLVANDRIINFYNMGNSRILVNARTGGNVGGSYSITAPVSRLAIYDYAYNTVVNVTDLPNIYQAFSVGEKVVYFESSFWFATSGVTFRVSIFDPSNNKTYSRTDFNVLGLGIPTSDSTFLIGFNPLIGGSDRLAVVNVSKDLHDATFNKDDIFEGFGFFAPTIAGANKDPYSPILYFLNNEFVFDGSLRFKNLKTGKLNTKPDGEVWSINLPTFKETYLGTFKDANNNFVYGGSFIDNRFVSVSWSRGLLTTKLYGQTQSVKNLTIPGVSIYPNPSVLSFVNVSLPEDGLIETLSVTGQTIFSQKVSFGVAQAPILPGINIVRVTIGGKTQTFKVVGQ